MVQAVLRTTKVPQLLPWFPAFAREEVAALVVDNGGMPGFAGYDAPRAVPSTVACARLFPHIMLCSLYFSAGPRSSASWWVWSRRTVVRAHVPEPVVVPQVQFLDKLICLCCALAGFMAQTVFSLSGGVAVAALDTVVDIPVVALGIPLTRWSTSLLTMRRVPAVVLDS